ncbi:uncharacterized protein A4U43_C07F5530 [Asparagus officinalis]|uniref:Protein DETOXIFICATION n=1 Tax=Asparagus officinalis TaxID=4686 RepID=A0A5P1E9S8_ASPOF|nr:protein DETOXIFICATION 53-like [Asparagus officinalis]ONK62574.1 uncharacterized protein A4U43_C07F5530 [Asparagus officinalis]
MCTTKISNQPALSEGNNEGEETVKGNGCVINEIGMELLLLGRIVWPIIISSFLLYSRSLISMFFLGHLGHVQLAGGSLAIAFANITGYSVLRGLSMGMEPICGQAFGAKKLSILSLTFQKTLLLLLLVTIPISLLWIKMRPILTHLGQEAEILTVAQEYVVFSLPDLMGQACLHPVRIFLRTQGLTKPLTLSATIAILLHIPINYVLVTYMGLGVKGVALASSWNTISIDLGLLVYLIFSNIALKPWAGASLACLYGWGPLIAFAVPSAISVCLEWWWYEVILLLCGLLADPESTVAATGILIQTTGLLYVIPYSLSMGLSTRVGHELGANRPAQARRATIVGLAVAIACGLMAYAFTLSVKNIWGKMFTSDPKTLALTSAVLPLIGFCELGNCTQTAGCGVLRGSARPTVGANINFGAFYIIGLPVAVLAGFQMGFGFFGLWLGLVAAQVTCAGLMLCIVCHTNWVVQAERAEELTGTAVEESDDLEERLLG